MTVKSDPTMIDNFPIAWYVRFNAWSEWWADIKEPVRSGLAAQLIRARWFSIMCGLVICFNVVYECFATNYDLQNLYEERSSFIIAMEIAFVSFYTAELLLKIFVH